MASTPVLLATSPFDLLLQTGVRFFYRSDPGLTFQEVHMGPTKVCIKGDALYDAKTARLIRGGFHDRAAMEDYASHHYLALPIIDKQGRAWELDGQPVYCLHGVRYETLDDHQPHLAACPDCGGMGIRVEEVTVERDCLRCVQCGHEFDARLQMMES